MRLILITPQVVTHRYTRIGGKLLGALVQIAADFDQRRPLRLTFQAGARLGRISDTRYCSLEPNGQGHGHVPVYSY